MNEGHEVVHSVGGKSKNVFGMEGGVVVDVRYAGRGKGRERGTEICIEARRGGRQERMGGAR